MSRIARVTAPADVDAFYHVIARVASGAYLLEGDEDKGRLIDVLYRAAEFSGVRIANYVAMDNHLHLIVLVPASDGSPVPAEEVLRRVEALYGADYARLLAAHVAAKGVLAGERLLDGYRRRMGDLGEFMKTFKQRYTQWYNRRRGHVGTLWTGRFKSVLVEGGKYLRALARYVDHNPLRAHMVEKGKLYRWSCQGAARGGDVRAVASRKLLAEHVGAAEVDWREEPEREPRFSNGVVMGSLEFVRRWIDERFPLNAGGRRRRPLPVVGDMFATHGGRSALRRAASVA